MILLLKQFIPMRIKSIIRSWVYDGYSVKSYSQEGEDMILKRIFNDKMNGFFIDVGAHHPKRFSNTYYFYKKGWSGINIDAMPGSMKLFDKKRSRDINLEVPVSLSGDTLPYYIFNEPALNGFDQYISEERDSDKETTYKIIDKINLNTKTLVSILDEFIPDNVKIDFMTIDVEGLDLDVIKSNNWNKYCPTVVLVEVLESSLSDVLTSEITKILAGYNYEVFAKSLNTVIYKKIF